jgi:type IV secretory pathway VirD2 relaxase
MALIEAELGNALYAAVKRKANNTKKLRAADIRAKASRVAAGSPEVMVKITGFGKGAGHVKAHLDYITRKGKLEMENDRGEIFTGKEEIKTLFKDWENDFAASKRHKNQRDTMHMVMSMPESTDPEAVRKAVRAFAQTTFGKNHEYVFVLHTDEPHPHCHVTVKLLGFNGKRLNPRKADLQQWREGFAEKLREQGVNAEATPRLSRGVVKKAEPSVLRHIERGDKTHEPRVSKVRAAKIKEVADELSAEAKGLPAASKPWESAIKTQQNNIRQAWLAAADALEQETPRITFNQQEPRNERPHYKQSNPERVRAGQHAAAVYQSNLEKSGQPAPPGTVASLRNVSSVTLVHHERAAKVLLQSDAPDRMGRERDADSEMRRTRTGLTNNLSGQERLEGYQSITEENKAFADRIRVFVAAMPTLDTERHQLKRDLTKRFSQQVEKTHSTVVEISPQINNVQTIGAEHPAPRGRDIER